MRKEVLVGTTAGIVLDLKVEISHGEKMEQGTGQGIDLEIGEEVGLVVGKVVNLGTKNIIGTKVMRVDLGTVIEVGLEEGIIDEVIEMGVRIVDQEEVVEGALPHTVEAEVGAEIIHTGEIAINPDLAPGQELQKDQRNVVAPVP